MVTEQIPTETFITQKNYKWPLATVLLIYLLINGWILVTSDFVPYIMEGNESYSSFTHASNLYSFGVSRSFGLSDEAASPDASAHPLIHSHQGNFPRLYAYLIYLLGARSIESQIAVTTFTIGMASVYFAFVFFSRVSSTLLALTFCLFLITDYVLFAQWNIVTYRTWHCFFVFSSLLCAQGFASPRRRTWIVLTFLNFMCLFYWELVFATYIAIMTGLYTGWIYRRNWRAVVLAWSIQLAGAVSGLAVVIVQLVAYLGWADFVQDIYLTFMARNYAPNDPAWLDELVNFYQSRNILFFHNFQSAENFASIEAFLRNIFTFSFQVHTPVLTFIVLLIFFGWLIGSSIHFWHRRCPPGSSSLKKESDGTQTFGGPTALLAMSLYLFFFFLYQKADTLIGFDQSGDPSKRVILLTGMVLALPLILFLASQCVRLSQMTQTDNEPKTLTKVIFGSLYLIGAMLFLSRHYRLYNQELSILWHQIPLSSNSSPPLVAVSAAALIGLCLILVNPQKLLNQGAKNLIGLLPFLLTGLVAFAVVYKLSPGYVYSGYLVRYAPFFIVFQVDTIITMALVILLLFTQQTYHWIKCFWDISHLKPARFLVRQSVTLGVGSGSLACFILVYWITLQLNYVSLFPFNHFTVLKKLEEPPFKGASFITNNYGPLIYTFTGQWAYVSNYMGEKYLQLTSEGFNLEFDRQYLWFADRYNRQDYSKPEFFLCFFGPTMRSAADRLSARLVFNTGCSTSHLVKHTSSMGNKIFQNKVVARDTSNFDAWTVVKLDWEFPPFLRLLDPKDKDSAVILSVKRSGEKMIARIDFDYAQQDGIPEGDTIVRLFALQERDWGYPIDQGANEGSLLVEGIRKKMFRLPLKLPKCLVATVTPKSLTKQGFQYTSPPICLPIMAF